MLIEVRNLSHVYAAGTPLAREALRSVDLSVSSGERLGVAGLTGSGKSTLMLHLAGLVRPSSGHVQLDGVDAYARSPEARRRRRRIGIALQYPEEQVFEQTVAREVAFGPRNLGLSTPEIEARVDWALEMVGLEPRAVRLRSPFSLSGGELRRVALASALAMHPEVLILDEPTAGLDPRGREVLLERIDPWQRTTGMTLVVVSHDLSVLARLVERTVILRGGEVVADGPTRRVLSDADTIVASGLQPPLTIVLLQTLRARGWSVATDRLLPADAAAAISDALARTAARKKSGPRTR